MRIFLLGVAMLTAAFCRAAAADPGDGKLTGSDFSGSEWNMIFEELVIPDLVDDAGDAWKLREEDFSSLDKVASIGNDVDIPEPPAADPDSWEMVKGEAACSGGSAAGNADMFADVFGISDGWEAVQEAYLDENQAEPAEAGISIEPDVFTAVVGEPSPPAAAEESVFSMEEIVSSTEELVSSADGREYAEWVAESPDFALTGMKPFSVGVFTGYGNERSVMYELFLKREFRPLWSGMSWAFSPTLRGSAFGWSRSGENIGGVAALAGLNFSFGPGECARPYVEAAVGPALLSSTVFGEKRFSTAFQFRSLLGFGVRFGRELRNSLEVQAAHFSNVGIKKPNNGYNSIGVAYGFAF